MRLFILLFPLLLFSESLRIGDYIQQTSFLDQNGATQTIYSNQELLIAWDKNTTAMANDYFDGNATLIDNKKISLLIDLSHAPKGILSLFILPSMREYRHTILVSLDEAYSQTLPFKKGYLTLLKLQEFKISNIIFFKEQEKFQELFEAKK